jgi:hypothetical protein
VSIFYLLAFITVLISLLLFSYLRTKRSHLLRTQLIQLIPTKDSDFDGTQVTKLITQIYSLTSPESLLARLSTGYQEIKLTVDSEDSKGARLLLEVDERYVESVKKLIYNCDSSIEVNLLSPKDLDTTKGELRLKYRLSRHYSYPLKVTKDPNAGDPLTDLVYRFGDLGTDEKLELSLSISPYNSFQISRLRNKLLKGHTPKLYSNRPIGLVSKFIWLTVRVAVKVTSLILNLISEVTKPYRSEPGRLKAIANDHGVVIDNPLTISQLDKLYEPLFKTRLEIAISSPDQSRLDQLVKDVDLSIKNYSAHGYQELKTVRHPIFRDVYSASELAGFYHLPKIDNLETIFKLNRFRELAPDNLFRQWQQESKDSVLIGANSSRGIETKIVLPEKARARHLYISGATGSGKSALISSLVVEDIKRGHSVSLIDPHGDLAKQVLREIPDSRLKDVIYFNPSDLNFPIGLNLLELKTFKNTKNYALETDQITESLISLFRKLFSDDDSGGHRVEYIIRNSVHTALTIRGATIFTIFKILTDDRYRKQVVGQLKDQNLVNFWQQELGKAGDYQRVKMSAGITAKIGRLLFSEPAKRVFGQQVSTINFDDLINENKILICNFSKGELGEDTSKLFGIATLTKLQLAALARANQSSKSRRPHYLYVDEFQNFATQSFTQMLSESRKYKLYLTIAEQSPSQQEDKLTSIILSNVGNLICFRNSSPRDEKLLLPLFSPYLSQGDLLNMPAYHFYMKTITEEALAPVSGRTLKPLNSNDRSQFNQVVKQSRDNYSLNLNGLSSIPLTPAGQLKLL